MKKFNVLIIVGAFLATSFAINGMTNVAKRVRSVKPALVGPKTQRQARIDLRQKRNVLAAEWQNIEKTEKREYARLGAFKAYSNQEIRYAHKERTRVTLENFEEQLSKKVPSKEQVALLEAEKSRLLKETEQLKKKQAWLEKHNSWKLSNDSDFVILPQELNAIRIDTIERQLAKYEKKQQQRQAKSE